jgi:galactokinase
MKDNNFNIESLVKKFYGDNEQNINYQIDRYQKLINKFKTIFSHDKFNVFSSPGRIEIGGNHTDHNNGKVLTASINLDSIAVVSKNGNNKITIHSEGFDKPFIVELQNLNIVENEKGTTNALIRGIAFQLINLGYNVGGFDACITSDVLPGSGLSSSASIEVLIGTILSSYYNENKIAPEEIAKIGQFAENNYFGKPCGLMDQMACAVGGIISIDFEDTENPIIERVDYNFSKNGYDILVVDTGGNHADLTEDYTSIPEEMKAIAKYFGKNVCREITMQQVFENIKDLRKAVGDRAILRAIHYLSENERVDEQIQSLKDNDLSKFLSLVSDSGNSSFKWLQNIYSNKNQIEQGISLALAVTEKYISKIGNGACRVHGGGFAGTILVFLPTDKTGKYIETITSIFGNNSANILSVRQVGSTKIS